MTPAMRDLRLAQGTRLSMTKLIHLMENVVMQYFKNTVVLVVIIPLLFATAGSAENGPKKVAILPFEMNAPEDLGYLREGILDMLSSRISWQGKVEVIEKQLVKNALAERQGPVNESGARQVGETLGADYVLFGSLTVFGESVSIDAKMIALKEERPPVAIYAQTKGMGEVVPRINDFAQDINNQIFGRGAEAVAAATPEPRFSTAHPDKLMTGPGPEPGPAAPRDSGSFVSLQSNQESSSDLFRSQKLKFAVNGMDVGDLDGDGRLEIVVVSEFKEVHVYQWDRGRLNKRSSFKGTNRDHLVWVCLADANHDGRAEVYVSNVQGERLSSYVLEWQGEKLTKLATDLQWYFNRLTVPGKDTILMGQKTNPEDVFMAGIYRLQFAGGSYKPLEGIPVPPKTNVFNFTQGDVDGDGKIETMFIGPEERLYLVDDDGTRLWSSREYYGATNNRLEGRSPTYGSTRDPGGEGATDADEVEIYYIPSPLLLADLNNDKRLEILANRNKSTSTRLLSKVTRNFSDGEIQSLFWIGDDILTQWKTRPLRGMVVSQRLADMDGDGQEELVVAAVLEKATFKKAKSIVYVYKLDHVRALSGKTSAPGIIESNM